MEEQDRAYAESLRMDVAKQEAKAEEEKREHVSIITYNIIMTLYVLTYFYDLL